MPLVTAQDYLYTALRKCGQMRPGYQNSPELLADGLTEWQMLYDGYNAKRTMQYTVPDYIYTVTGPGSAVLATGQSLSGTGFTIGLPFTFQATTTSTQSVMAVANTIGLELNQAISGTGIQVGARITAISPNVSVTMSLPATASGTVAVTVTADFVGPRPERIVKMNLYMTSAAPLQPIRIPIHMVSAEEWASLPVLALQPINVTTTAYYEARFPNGVIWVWPPLNANGLEIFTYGTLVPPLSLSSLYSAPPGYQDVVVWELAKRLYPMVTLDVAVHKVSHAWLCGQAALARAAVQNINAPMPKLANDFQSGRTVQGVSDWDLLLTGQPY